MSSLQLTVLDGEFTVCKLHAVDGIDLTHDYTFLSVTDDEISCVCPSAFAPPNPIAAEHGWRAMKINGVLDFGMIGVIAKISGLLAEKEISVFVISTYNTDYVLVKAAQFGRATAVLEAGGYEITLP